MGMVTYGKILTVIMIVAYIHSQRSSSSTAAFTDMLRTRTASGTRRRFFRPPTSPLPFFGMVATTKSCIGTPDGRAREDGRAESLRSAREPARAPDREDPGRAGAQGQRWDVPEQRRSLTHRSGKRLGILVGSCFLVAAYS